MEFENNIYKETTRYSVNKFGFTEKQQGINKRKEQYKQYRMIEMGELSLWEKEREYE